MGDSLAAGDGPGGCAPDGSGRPRASPEADADAIAVAVTGGTDAPADAAWEVITENSEYLLDLAAGRVRRIPVAAEGLRGDGAWVRLRGVVNLRAGQPMVLVLQFTDDGIVTVRCTSPVLRIRKLASPPGMP